MGRSYYVCVTGLVTTKKLVKFITCELTLPTTMHPPARQFDRQMWSLPQLYILQAHSTTPNLNFGSRALPLGAGNIGVAGGLQ